MKKEKAMTIISLVLTIVILIILAGIAINLSLSENGIFNKAKQAREYYEVETNNEKALLSDVNNEIDRYIDNYKKISYEMKIDTLSVIGTGNGSTKQGHTQLIIDARNYSKLTLNILNMASANYNRLYIYNGKLGEENCECIMNMFSERSGESGIHKNLEYDVSQYDYITIYLESGRGDEVYIKDLILQ